MRKTASVTIEGWTYELSQLGAVEGRTLVLLFVKLFGRFAPVLASGLKAAGKVESAEGMTAALLNSPHVIDDLAHAITNVDQKELEPFWDAFSRHAVVRGKDGKTRQPLHEIFDEHFAGEYFAMTRFFVESAKLNFGDFLSKALAQASAKPSGQAAVAS